MAQKHSYRVLIAVFAAVLYVALIIAVAGVIGLLTNREVLIEADAGPLLAPAMVVTAAMVLTLQLLWAGIRVSRPARSNLFIALVIGVVCYFFYVAVGAVLYSISDGDPLRGVIFFGANALVPFALSIGILASIVAVAYLSLMTYRDHGGASQTPRWPWEQSGDEDRKDL